MKWSMIINNKNGIYKLLNELPNDVRLQENLKAAQNYSLAPSLPSRLKILPIAVKK